DVLGKNVKAKADVELHFKRTAGQGFVFNVEVDGEALERANKPIRINMPYKPTQLEMQKTHNIVVKRIDNLQAVIVPNARFNENSKAVILETNHFGQYHIEYVSKSFADIATYDWAKGAIEGLAARDVIQGTGENQFAPERAVTRAEFITMLVRALDLQAQRGETSFTDVNQDAYYYEPLNVAKDLGIVQGTGDNRFNPNAHIARQDLFTMTARA
ncbi:S-layer homology domain-containing protein, partial [Bacillaceae bacterium SIJ1]|uniref:S-layer homology domain-containing protein n=1 Tax=Litoribacterium kuwaitense TaxID=1398745 RepID=UPI0013EDA3E7